MSTILKTGPAPHIRTSETVESVMYDVIIALVPAFIMAFYSFGIRALILTSVSVLSCIVTEYICQKALKQDINVFDGSAILTGILFAFVVPAVMPLQYVVVGSVVAIALGKMVYGGLGHNIFNPALVGRAFVQASWPVAITTFAYDGKAGATVLDAMKRDIPLTDALLNNGNQYLEAFLGRMGGCLGETSALALLIGGAYLIYKKHIDWKVPAVMIGTVFVLTAILGADPFMQIFSGGLFLGAFFMATDMVTSPVTSKGRVIFALGLGILISLIRIKGGYPEGTAYAILIMNGVVPLIDRYIKPKKFGGVITNGK
ncbi:RnfABCDGE type electron transport complex subunit D [Fusobacterium gastrosuis]|uniref:RnfABCDGE type electron transport complex subunit D n=1 Tax=Fusobacterium gastrosuis TaxID=1755100 RepID=UPI00297182F7|nr:RnfABCDGE type electron transport complex subunit D [Fusobacteriaceae bacterium]MDD7411542.1 RnfABCDGE type electron transport complex subunit D [Fusobacteriaceae bacterium]MDY5712662.1 RnfABCDGE type electron transport complex subunit D [Fusobacterium gastrosuis]MDY5795395.1 RnfABCDGE type electron transport complex subunit D [Fusobacterium gastrosuis]